MNLRPAGWLAFLLLAACGGGGGGGGGGSGASLTFEPHTLVATWVQGESVAVNTEARVHVGVGGAVYVVVVDAQGVIKPAIGLSDNGDGTYRVSIDTSATVAAGHYQQALVIHLCKDPGCSAEWGTPTNLPYDFTVLPTTGDLKTLSALPGAQPWQTYQGNNRHDGHQPVTLDPAQFSFRWYWRDSPYDAPLELNAMTVSQGAVMTSTRDFFIAHQKVYRISEDTGQTVWAHDFGNLYMLNPPAVYDGITYVATSGWEDTAMWALDADGNELFSTPFNSQAERYYAPVKVGTRVYTNGGTYGGAYAFNTADGSEAWFASLNQHDAWTPAVDGGLVYAYVGDCTSSCNTAGLYVLDAATGASSYAILDPNYAFSGYSVEGAPVLGAAGSVLMMTNRHGLLSHFDTVGHNVDWTVAGGFSGNPAVAGGVVYAARVTTDELVAIDETDGSELWAWHLPATETANFASDVLVTDNIAFVSTTANVYAIDLATHEAVWSYPLGGTLAMSENGILYVQTGSAIAAFNLQ